MLELGREQIPDGLEELEAQSRDPFLSCISHMMLISLPSKPTFNTLMTSADAMCNRIPHVM
jgi:hypothetical protein